MVCAFPVFSQELFRGTHERRSRDFKGCGKEEGNGIHVLRKQNGNYLKEEENQPEEGQGRAL